MTNGNTQYQPQYQQAYPYYQPIQYQYQQDQQTIQQDRDRKLGILLALVSIGLGIKRYLIKQPSTTQTQEQPITSITVSPCSINILKNTTQQLLAYDQNNNLIQSSMITWNSSNISIATIDSSGIVHSLSAGNTTITARISASSDQPEVISNQCSINILSATITVAKDGTGDYTTIQAGVNAATAGQTIYVKNGTYDEKVDVAKSISLFGQSKSGTIIDGSNTNLSVSWPPALVYLHADNITFSGFKVQNPTAWCIPSTCATGKVCPDPSCTDFASHTKAILAYGKNNINIENNNIYRSARGSAIEVGQCKFVKVRYNEISRTHYLSSSGQETLSISGGTENFEVSYNYQHDNAIRDDGHETNEGGLFAKGVRNGSIHHNFLKNNAENSIYVDGWDAPPTNPQKNIQVYKNIVTKYPPNAPNVLVRGIIIANEMAGTSEHIDVYDNIVYNCESGFQIWCGGGNPAGYVKGLCFKNNILYKNGKGIFLGNCQTYQPSSLGTCSTTVPLWIKDNTIANNTWGNFQVQNGVPSTAFISTDWVNNNNTFTLTQSEFDTKYNTLYNEIKLLNDSLP